MSNKKGIKIEDIISLYNNGSSVIEIAETFGCSISNISSRLKKQGIEYKPDRAKYRLRARCHCPNRHQLNENYFENIDSEDKAYFLGLMYADGSVTDTIVYIKITDDEILDKFNACIEGDYKIITNSPPENHPTQKHSYRITISSKVFSSFLQKWGCVPNKTRKITLPNIDKSLYKHFIRGFFDGDGSIILDKILGHCCINFTSASLTFLEQLQEVLKEHALTNGGITKETKYEVWHLRFGGKQVIKILDWLYEDAHFFLKRKYYKYQLLSPLKMGRIAGKSGGIISSRANL